MNSSDVGIDNIPKRPDSDVDADADLELTLTSLMGMVSPIWPEIWAGKERWIIIQNIHKNVDLDLELHSWLNGASETKMCEAKKMLNIDLLHSYFISQLDKMRHFCARAKIARKVPFMGECQIREKCVTFWKLNISGIVKFTRKAPSTAQRFVWEKSVWSKKDAKRRSIASLFYESAPKNERF